MCVVINMCSRERNVSNLNSCTLDFLTTTNTLYVGPTTFVTSRDGFPTSVNNVIYLPPFSTWIVNGTVDLLGSRLVCLGNVSISGYSSETCFLKSTGLLTGLSLITSAFTVNLKYITFGCPDNCAIFDLNSNGSNGIDLIGVNFGGTNISCGTVGVMANFTNVIFESSAFLDIKGGLTFTGTIGTIGFSDCLFSSFNCVTPYIILSSGLTVTRRFRYVNGSIVVFTTGIYYDNSIIPSNSFILNNVNFSGPGTKIFGVNNDDLKSRWSGCIGIKNSFNLGQFTINDNVINTIVVQNVYTQILGSAILQPSSRFTLANNTLTYIGAASVLGFLSCNFSIQSSNNQTIDTTFIFNGVVQNQYHTTTVTTGANSPFTGSFMAVVELATNNYFSIVVKNKTSSSNVLIENLTFIIHEINT